MHRLATLRLPTLRVGTLLCLVLSVACASSGPEMRMMDGIEPLEDRAAVAPAVGGLFPDITVVDDQGRPVNIRSLAGEKPYTVLTLGCLT